MLKLYRFEDEKKKYWETWEEEDGSYTVHEGSLGKKGNSTVVRGSLFRKAAKKVQAMALKKRKEGFAPIALEAHHVLLIEFEVDGFGTPEDVEKRYRLQERMDNVLGWAGLGHCDGGSIGSGTMEACCYVVDFSLAKAVIERNLANTEFKDYTRIYEEGR